MAIETKFVDEEGTDLNKYKMTKENGDIEDVYLNRDANITQVGTPLTAEVMNALVDSSNTLEARVNSIYDYLTVVSVSVESVTGTIANSAGLYITSVSTNIGINRREVNVVGINATYNYDEASGVITVSFTSILPQQDVTCMCLETES